MSLLAVFTTVATEAQADELARGAVEQGLAACVQVEPVRSTYRWQGRVEQDGEARLLFKTTEERYPDLEQWIKERHPYELPAIYALPVQQSTPDYEGWVQDAVLKP